MKKQKIVNRSDNSVKFRCMNKKCDLKGQEVSEETCENCSFAVVKHEKPCKKKQKVKAENKEEVKDYPPVSIQMINYKDALIRWQKAGKPTRSEEEVNKILETCKTCDWYDEDKKRCRGCGCKVTTSSFAILNKAKMATEHCPKGEW